MAFSLTWLSQVLLDAGLKVAEQSGWQNRGRGDVGRIVGVICHHTSGPKTGNMPSLGVVINGRDDLQGPLAQLCLGRDGTFFVVAAGRCNHAGMGNWQGFTSGNTNFIGIEAENTGELRGPGADFPWPTVQMDAYRHGVAAILKKIGANAIMCCGHKEYALPMGRKDDPSFDMNEFRRDVAAIMAGAAPHLSIIPAIDSAGRPTLRRGDTGELVKQIQTKLGVGATGNFDGETEAAVRQFQFDHGLVPDGIVGPRAWATLDGQQDTSPWPIRRRWRTRSRRLRPAPKRSFRVWATTRCALLRRAIAGFTDPELTPHSPPLRISSRCSPPRPMPWRPKRTAPAAAPRAAPAQQAKDLLGQLIADTRAFEQALADFQDARNAIFRKTEHVTGSICARRRARIERYGGLSQGNSVDILADNDDGTWLLVSAIVDGTTRIGWIRLNLLPRRGRRPAPATSALSEIVLRRQSKSRKKAMTMLKLWQGSVSDLLTRCAILTFCACSRL